MSTDFLRKLQLLACYFGVILFLGWGAGCGGGGDVWEVVAEQSMIVIISLL